MTMARKTVPVSKIHYSEETLDQCREVLKSGYLREGKHVKAFEDAFASFTGAKHAIACSSGTAALHLAYLALLKPGDQVLTTPFTFISTSSMLVAAGARPVFCDVCPETLNIDPRRARESLTGKITALAPVHLFGNSCDVKALMEISSQRNLRIIWDAAQSLGTRFGGKDIGSYSDAACFSFYPTKNIATGEGGMVTTQCDETAAKIRLLKAHGESERYHHEMFGWNYRMTEVAAVLGLAELKQLPSFLKRRKQIASLYLNAFKNLSTLMLPAQQRDSEHSYNYFSVCLNLEQLDCSRNQFAEELSAEGIQYGIHYPKPLHLQPCFRSITGDEKYPVAERAADSVIALPMHPYLEDSDVAYVSDKVREILSRHTR